MNIHETTLEINGYQFDMRVMYKFYAGSKGKRNEYGVPVEPDDPSSVEIERVAIEHGDNGNYFEIDLPQIVLDDIADKILEEEL